MQNRLHFISGLPRSGSTLLAALLRQNPRFSAGNLSIVPVAGTSPAVPEVSTWAMAPSDSGALPRRARYTVAAVAA